MSINPGRAKAWWEQLPFPYSSCKVTEGFRPEGFRFHPHIINIEAELSGHTIRSCGEADSEELAMTKAVAELVERSALFAWKQKYQAATSSNGWAAHSDFESAKTAARLELIERDAVLAQWYTATPFLQIANEDLAPPIRQWQITELGKSEFPILRVLLSTRGVGPSITCVLMNEQGFGVSSHATRVSLADSIESAIAEACRSAHLSLRKAYWQDTLQLKTGGGGREANGAHAVYYAYHEPLPAWMFGNVLSWESANTRWQERIAASPDDFSFELVMEAPLAVGFASSSRALPLIWGPTDIEKILVTPAGKRLADNRNEWNLKPHIIS